MTSGESATKLTLDSRRKAPLETVEMTTGENPQAAVIWLHGLGADGHDFEAIVPHLDWPGAPPVRYVFPHAPVRPVTINAGMPMRAWYDIVSLGSGHAKDVEGIAESVDRVAALVERERERGIPAEKIVLAGFSQGGAIALLLALRYPQRLAGLMALSTYLLFAGQAELEASAANGELPVFVGHGNQDPVVPLALGRRTAEHLRALGHPVEWHEYPMPHAVCPEEISDLANWLRQRLG